MRKLISKITPYWIMIFSLMSIIFSILDIVYKEKIVKGIVGIIIASITFILGIGYYFEKKENQK